MTRHTAPAWARITVLVASLGLLAAFALPLWKITLEAPQYPEGLGMLIRVNTITGLGPHDLPNINNLNHYIGMKPIVPESIPELRLMPWILGALAGWGMLAAAVGRRWMICGFFTLLAVTAVAGLADFWRWGYDYGHDLDVENAAIRIPGMAYQPPVIGSKQLLNFTAHSWPATGGWLALASGLAAAVACIGTSLAARDRRRRATPGGEVVAVGLGVLATLGLAGCAPERPVPIVVGEDVCDHCVMAIQEPRFAAEAITVRGKLHRFDSIECLAGWVVERSDPDPALDGATLWVTDMRAPGDWIPIERARFLRSPAIQSPMGMHLAAVPADAEPGAAPGVPDGAQSLSWETVLELVREAGGHSGLHGDTRLGGARHVSTGAVEAAHGTGH